MRQSCPIALHINHRLDDVDFCLQRFRIPICSVLEPLQLSFGRRLDIKMSRVRSHHRIEAAVRSHRDQRVCASHVLRDIKRPCEMTIFEQQKGQISPGIARLDVPMESPMSVIECQQQWEYRDTLFRCRVDDIANSIIEGNRTL
jgi:hypothetical protein